MEPVAEYYVDSSAFEVIDHSCKYFGSSYLGRNAGTYNLLGIQHKTPIIVEEDNGDDDENQSEDIDFDDSDDDVDLHPSHPTIQCTSPLVASSLIAP